MTTTTTTYGTIPIRTSSQETWFRSDIGQCRPWKEMVVSLALPNSFNASLSRIKANISYFHTNYAIIILFVLFLSLLWRPVSLIVFLALMAAWLFLYFFRDDPVIFLGYAVDERFVLAVLSIATFIFVITGYTATLLVAVLIGLVVALLHAVLRKTDDLVFVDQEEGRGGPARLHLKETASSSFSSSS